MSVFDLQESPEGPRFMKLPQRRSFPANWLVFLQNILGYHRIMILVFTGDGKGKTTAALGQAVRAVGEGKRVLVVQFIKGPWRSGEDEIFEKFQIPKTRFQILKTGLGFVGILGDALPFADHQTAAREGLARARREIESDSWDIVILDEINNAVSLELLSQESVLDFLDFAEPKIEHLILTGRGAPEEFLRRADLVTDMQDMKHPYEKGIKAARGLEY